MSLVLLSISRLNRVPLVDVDHAPTSTVATEAYTSSLSGPPISVSISGVIPARNQLSSTSGPGKGLETPPTVSDHAVLTIVVVNNW